MRRQLEGTPTWHLLTLLISGRVEKGPSGPTAIETRVGWVLSGPIESDSTDQITVGFVDIHILRVDTRSDQLETDEGLRQFWELKSTNRGVSPLKVYSRNKIQRWEI